MRKRVAVVLAIALMLPQMARSQSFDFESTPSGYSPFLQLTNLGLTVTITPEGTSNGWLLVFGSGSALVGTGVIGSHVNPVALDQFAPLRFSFSQPIDAITFNFGDQGGDDDSPVFINWYSATDVLLGTHSDTYPADFATGKSALLSNTGGASYFIVSSTPSFNPHSLWWDISSVTPGQVVPEPSTFVLLGAGMAALFVYRRRRVRA